MFGPVAANGFDQWAYEDRLVDLTDTVGPLAGMFDADALAASMLLNGRTGKRALYTLSMGAHHQPHPRLEQPVGARGLYPCRHSKGMGRVLVILVRSGAVCGAEGYAPRRHLGRGSRAVSRSRRYRGGAHAVPVRLSRACTSVDGRVEVDNPTVRANLIEALEAYTAIYRKGCTPPDAIGWENKSNNDAFVAQIVVMTLNEALSIPNAIKASRPDDYRQNTATIEWPNGAYRQPMTVYGGIYRGAVFRTDRPAALGEDFVRFLVEDGWLAHYLDFARDRWLPPMTKLVKAPFWLDPSDPHRMASAIQALTRAHHYDVGSVSDRAFGDRTWQKAVQRVAAEGWTPGQAVDEAIARIKQLVRR